LNLGANKNIRDNSNYYAVDYFQQNKYMKNSALYQSVRDRLHL